MNKTIKKLQKYSNKKVYATGSHFFYAKNILIVDEIVDEKKRLGKSIFR